MGLICNVINFRVNTYEVVRELWKWMAVPKIMYGAEIIGWTQKEKDALEVTQNRMGKKALGAPLYTAVEAVRGDMGWSSFGERISKAKLKYHLRIVLCDELNPLKKVYNWYQGNLFVRDCNKLCKRYGIRWVIGEGDLRIGGTLVGNFTQGARLIDRAVGEVGLRKWRDGCNLKSTLRYYRKRVPGREPFFSGNWGSRLLFRARSDTLELNGRKRGQGGTRWCERCGREGDREVETLEHVLVECAHYSVLRERWMNSVRNVVGEESWTQMRDGELGECISQLLGFGGRSDLAELTRDFLVGMWARRGRAAVPGVSLGAEHNYIREPTRQGPGVVAL